MATEKRLIDANALMKRFYNYYDCVNEFTSKNGYRGETLMNYEVADMIYDCIDNAPTVDAVEVVHGRWLSAYEYGLKLGITDKEKLEELKEDKWWKFCNGCEQQVKGFHNYCPNCGAKMMRFDDALPEGTKTIKIEGVSEIVIHSYGERRTDNG